MGMVVMKRNKVIIRDMRRVDIDVMLFCPVGGSPIFLLNLQFDD